MKKITKENLIKIIDSNFKPKDVGIDILYCISEDEQVENLANELLEAINHSQCSTLLKNEQPISFDEWLEDNNYIQDDEGYCKGGVVYDYAEIQQEFNEYTQRF